MKHEKRMEFRLPAEIKETLCQIKEQQNITPSEYVRMAITEKMERESLECKINAAIPINKIYNLLIAHPDIDTEFINTIIKELNTYEQFSH